VAEEGVPLREIAEVIGRRLNMMAVSKPLAEAAEQFSFMSPFIPVDNAVTSKLTRERLGWSPTQPGADSSLSMCRVLSAPLLALLYYFGQIHNRTYLDRSKSILKAWEL